MEEEEDEEEEEEEEKKERRRKNKKWRRKNKRGVGKIGVMSVASIFQKAVVKLKVRLRGCFNITKIDKTFRSFIFLITLALCKIFV